MKTTCPTCGRLTPEGAFCEKCGAAMSAPQARPPEGGSAQDAEPSIVAAESRIEKETSDAAIAAREGKEPVLEYDRYSMLCERMNGSLRFRFSPSGAVLENVSFTFSNGSGVRLSVGPFRRVSSPMPFPVQFPPQEAGMQAWEVKVGYRFGGRRRELAGRFEVYVHPVESRKRALDNFNISISTNIGNVSQASDVSVNQRGVDEFAKIISANDVIGEMNRRVVSEKRDWAAIQLFDDSRFSDLPPMPANARVDRLTLGFGGRLVHLFAGRTIRFGRKRELSDFVLRPPEWLGEAERTPYLRVSREHCLFEHSGPTVLISDGSRSPSGVIKPSSAGTYFNGARIVKPVAVPSGASGVVSFGGGLDSGALSMELKACDSAAACAACPVAERSWSGDGSRPCLVLSRTDGVAEKFVGLWSCFSLGDADPSFAGYVIFRKDGAFAYACEDGRTGWLVPGGDLRTDFGNIHIN